MLWVATPFASPWPSPALPSFMCFRHMFTRRLAYIHPCPRFRVPSFFTSFVLGPSPIESFPARECPSAGHFLSMYYRVLTHPALCGPERASQSVSLLACHHLFPLCGPLRVPPPRSLPFCGLTSPSVSGLHSECPLFSMS